MNENYSDEIANLANNFIDSLSSSYPSFTLACVGFLFIFILGGFLLWRRDRYRPSQMKKIAEKYGLHYTGMDKDNPLKIIKDAIILDYRENIIEGKIKDREVLVYDHTKFDARGLVIHGSLAAISRFTVVSVDGSDKKLSDFPLGGVAAIKKIDSVLADLAKA